MIWWMSKGELEQFGVRISDFGFGRRGERWGKKGWKLALLLTLEEIT